MFLASLLLISQQLPTSSFAESSAADPGVCAVNAGSTPEAPKPCAWDQKSYGVVRFVSFGNGIDRKAHRQLTELVGLAMLSSNVKHSTHIETRGLEGESALCLHLGILNDKKRAALVESVRSIASSRVGVVFWEGESCIKATQDSEEKRGAQMPCKATLPNCFPRLYSYCNVTPLSPLCRIRTPLIAR